MANRITKAWKVLTGTSTPEVRTAPSTGSTLLVDLLRGSESDVDNKTFYQVAQKAFEQNVVGYRCTSMIANSVGALTFCLKKGDKEVTEHALLDLLNRPNPLQGKGSFFAHATGSKLLDGNIFIEAAGPFQGPPKELWVLRPDYVQVIMGYSRLPQAYVYTPNGTGSGGGKTFPVDPITGASPLFHMMSYSPLFETSMGRGLSPMRSAWLSILTHTEGQNWNHSLLKNGARPSGAFVTGKGMGGVSVNLSPEQLENLKAQVLEKYVGSGKAGMPMLLDGGLDWKEMSLSPKDADFIQLKNSASRDIALALGVPPMLLGIPGDNTFSNMKEAKEMFYLDTVLPHAYALVDELNRWLVPKFGDDLVLYVDENTIPALDAKRAEKRIATEGSTIMTINEKRLALGLGKIGPEGDQILIPTNLIPLGAALDDSEVEPAAGE